MSGGQDFTLLMVNQLSTSVGELNAKVDRLITDVASQSSKLDGIKTVHAWVYGGTVALIAAAGLLGAIYAMVPQEVKILIVKKIFGLP